MSTFLMRSVSRNTLSFRLKLKDKPFPILYRCFAIENQAAKINEKLAKKDVQNLVKKNDQKSNAPEISDFLGASSEYTTEINFQDAFEPFTCFRRLNRDGTFVDENYDLPLSNDELILRYKTMCQMNVMDSVFYDAQRQGRISFYMTHYGEEALQIGSASALDLDDHVYAQYREAGVIMWRGFNLSNFANQCFATQHDLGKGRQMPIHYGSNELNYHTISSPLGTQISQAAGAGYAFAREKKPNVVICYFGDGAASTGDFHAALNFAACLSSSTIFFCRNNGYAISTRVDDQYKGDGIAARGTGYGLPTIRVDGGDLLACYEATLEARRIVLEEKKPVLIEAMCYRGGHHSTSDDSTTYRTKEEIEFWSSTACPVSRVRLLLERLGVWDSDKEMELLSELRSDVLYHLSKAEKIKKPPTSQLFTDVYDNIPSHLQQQQEDLEDHLNQNGKYYGLKNFANDESYRQPSL